VGHTEVMHLPSFSFTLLTGTSAQQTTIRTRRVTHNVRHEAKLARSGTVILRSNIKMFCFFTYIVLIMYLDAMCSKSYVSKNVKTSYQLEWKE
jgi:hypothetical protein